MSETCCDHGLNWHHETRGCGYHGFSIDSRCDCRLTFDQALADHDRRVEARALREVERLRSALSGETHAPGPSDTRHGHNGSCVKCLRATKGELTAELARQGSEIVRLSVALQRAEAKRAEARALREAADAGTHAYVRHEVHTTGELLTWLHDRADRIEGQ